MSSVQILATIQNLEAQLAVLKSIVQEATPVKKAKKEKDPDAPKKQPSEGVLRWNALIAETLEKMKADDWIHPETGKPATRKDAMAAASANKKAMSVEASPSRAAASEENHGKANSVAEESGTESDKGKKGPKKGSHWSAETKAAAAAKRAAKKMSTTPPLPSSPKVEDE